MEGFQFIIESPQEAQSQKKRPRLVTSCDNCRLKKIKCLQPSPESQCEACKVAKIQCRFRDRERYFAERSRAIAGPGLTRPAGRPGYTTPHDTPSRPTSTVPDFSPPLPSIPQTPSLTLQRSSSYSPPQSVGHASDAHVRYPSYPPDHAKSSVSHNGTMNGHRVTQHPSAASGLPSFGGGRVGQSTTTGQYRPSILFDPVQPCSPPRAWMQQFIQLFITNVGAQCPFLTYDDLCDRFRRQALPPLLSNAIAALGVRYSDIQEVHARGSQAVAEIYADAAKEQLSTSLQNPSVDTLHAAILLAWTEYKGGRGHGFRQYSDLAMQTAMAIGLSEESSLQLSPYDAYQNRLRMTWSSLNQLRLYASSCMPHPSSHGLPA